MATVMKRAGGARVASQQTTRDRELLKDGDRFLGLWMRNIAKTSYLELVRKYSLQEQLEFFDKLENYMLNMRSWEVYNAVKQSPKYKQLMAFLYERMKNTAKLDAVVDERQKFQIEFEVPEGWDDDGLAKEVKVLKNGTKNDQVK